MFHTLIIKFNKNMTEKTVKLCSNLVTHVQKYQNGELKRIYSAISIFQSKGAEYIKVFFPGPVQNLKGTYYAFVIFCHFYTVIMWDVYVKHGQSSTTLGERN